MKFSATLLSLAALVPAFGQDQPTARETQNRLNLVATRALANFRSADSIEYSLRGQGNTLHPQLAAMRMRVEAALDQAEGDLKKSNLQDANEALDRAQGWLDRLSRRLGGY